MAAANVETRCRVREKFENIFNVIFNGKVIKCAFKWNATNRGQMGGRVLSFWIHASDDCCPLSGVLWLSRKKINRSELNETFCCWSTIDNSSTCASISACSLLPRKPSLPVSNRALNKPVFCVYFVNILIRGEAAFDDRGNGGEGEIWGMYHGNIQY